MRRSMIILGSLVLALSGCSSNKYEVKQVDTKMDVQGHFDGKSIGLDDKNQAIIQQETSAESELKQQQLKNYDTERKLNYNYAQLTQCRQELADPRLGGNGQMTEIPEIDQMKGTGQIKEDVGLTEQGQLEVVKKEYYIDRLQRERRYGDTMKDMLRLIDKYNHTCQQEMGVARVKVGLPSERYQAVGHFDPDGNWVLERKAEKTLDDAFEIRGPARSVANQGQPGASMPPNPGQ